MTIIAIDGPSGSGKSTIARLVAERLGLPYLDTGAMYRAVALIAVRRGLDLKDAEAITMLAATAKFQLLDERSGGKLLPRVMVEGLDASLEVRTPEITQGASTIAVHAALRDRLVRRQRTWVDERGGAVVEGRDIGTVVFPQANLKVFLTAHHDERVRRRQQDAHSPHFGELHPDEAAAELAERDSRDATREASPLVAADDALIVDTTGQDVEDTVMEVLTELRKRFGGELPSSTAAR